MKVSIVLWSSVHLHLPNDMRIKVSLFLFCQLAGPLHWNFSSLLVVEASLRPFCCFKVWLPTVTFFMTFGPSESSIVFSNHSITTNNTSTHILWPFLKMYSVPFHIAQCLAAVDKLYLERQSFLLDLARVQSWLRPGCHSATLHLLIWLNIIYFSQKSGA